MTMNASPQAHGWNFANAWEAIAERVPDAPAQLQGERTFTWSAMDRRADGIARVLLDSGASEQDKVALYLHNCPEYMETVFALFKAGLVPVNTNYRYSADELVYLWDNADAVAVVFHGTFAERIDPLRHRVPAVKTWLWVDDSTGGCPPWAVPYEAAASAASSADSARTVAPWGRRGEHLLLLYTGGTTGMPKGVMWQQTDLLGSLDATSKRRLPPEEDLDALGERITGPGPRNLPAAPLMHGTGLFNAMTNMLAAGCIVTMEGRHFDPVELLDTIERRRITSMSIVGDAFAKPILRALDAEPTRWDFSSLRVVVSSGVMWSAESKAGLLRHNERLIMVDALGSSEAIGMAQNTVSKDGASGGTAKFELGPFTKVLTEDGREVTPGSSERGRVALRGFTPVGYYKDPEKSASTFQVFDGVRWSIPGDWAEVEADGSVRLLGRGSQCINTGGEKVYPEEVEEVLKEHPSVADAAVIGVPDERFGQAITALVEPHVGFEVDEAALIAHVKARLAHYKAPKRVLPLATVGRAANGKLDYRQLTSDALERFDPPAR